MDRLSQLRGEAGGSRDSTLDTTSPPSEAFMSANENSSKYFSINDSTFDITPIKDISLASTSSDADRAIADNDELISNLSPIGKKELLDSYKIGKQIEAANILSGGVDIFDDNSFDGDELVIDDNVEAEDKVPSPPKVLPVENISESDPVLVQQEPEPVVALEVELEMEIKAVPEVVPVEEPQIEPEPGPQAQADEEPQVELELEPQMEPELGLDLAPQIEPSLEQQVEPELELQVEPVLEQHAELEREPQAEPVLEQHVGLELEPEAEPELDPQVEPELDPQVEPELAPEVQLQIDYEANRENEVVLLIDGQNLNAIDIGNGLYLYRKDGLDELAAVQILNNDPKDGYKFLKVRDNFEGNLEVYEEIEIEVPREVPVKEANPVDNAENVPTKDVKPSTSASPSTSKQDEGKSKSQEPEPVPSTSKCDNNIEKNESSSEPKKEADHNGKMKKISETRNSPVVSSFKPMTFHSTPNKEGKPLTKTMVDFQLDPNRHSDIVKKTIEVHTDNIKQKSAEPVKEKVESVKSAESVNAEKDVLTEKTDTYTDKQEFKKDNTCNNPGPSGYVAAKCSKNSGETSKSENNIVKEEPIAEKSDIKDGAVINHSKKSNSEEVKSDIIENAPLEKLGPINNQQSSMVVLKPKAVLPPLFTSSKEVNKAADNKVTSATEKTTCEPEVNQPKKVETVNTLDLNINKETEYLSENKNELTGSTVKLTTPNVVESIQNVTPQKEQLGKDKLQKINEIETASSNMKTGLTNTKLNDTESEGRIVSSNVNDNVVNFPLEFQDASSTCTNLGSEESKEESITLYSIDTDESVSLITPSSTSSTTNEKVVINDNMSEVLTTISNFSNLQNENTKQEHKVPIVKKTVVPPKSEVHSSSQASFLESASKLEKTKTTELSNSQKIVTDTSLIHSGIAASSIPTVSVKESDIGAANPDPKGKLSAARQTTVPELKPIKDEQPVASKIKSSDKVVTPGTKPSAKVPQVISAPLLNPTERLEKSTVTQNVKGLEKQIQRMTKPESKPLERVAVSSGAPSVNFPEKKYLIPTVKPLEKTAITTVPAAMKHPEISSTTSIRLVKPESHIPVVSIANKPSSKHIPAVALENEELKHNNIVIQNEMPKNNAGAKKPSDTKFETRDLKEPIKKPDSKESKPVNNNHTAAVPFGKWTDAHRQEFVNKFKEVKAPITTNSKQIKNSNDLNRRDVLKKIDSQRAQTISNATAKAQEKANVKTESVFSSKVVPPVEETKIIPKSEILENKPKQVSDKPKQVSDTVNSKQDNSIKAVVSSTVPTKLATDEKVENVCKTKTTGTDHTNERESLLRDSSNVGKLDHTPKIQNSADKSESAPREQNTASCYMASLIDKTIEDMINRVVPSKNADEIKQTVEEPVPNVEKTVSTIEVSGPTVIEPVSLDDIEMKMNELHGIPFVERPPHELPKIPNSEIKTYNKHEKSQHSNKTATNTLSELKPEKDADSDEEIIEHEPITGDIELKNKNILVKSHSHGKNNLKEKSKSDVPEKGVSKKGTEIITETDFDKFARRNSITYENCLTVNFNQIEKHNLVQTVKEKDPAPKLKPKLDSIRNEVKSKLPYKRLQLDVETNKTMGATKPANVAGDSKNKKYQSKLHSAYQSVLTAKHQISRPISIIEDKPVKVVFLESSIGFVPSQLNVQGKELSPAKNPVLETDTTVSVIDNDSVDSVMLEDNDVIINHSNEVIDDNKQQDKTKTKHQRKQVLTPVEAPDLELIQPSDIGIENPAKKKRKLEDVKAKNLVPKKSYLLGRNNTMEDKTANAQALVRDSSKDTKRNEDVPEHKDAASAIDNLVKAAELLENQEETLNKSIAPNLDTEPNTPVKRGRGRPRKYPLPDGVVDNKTPSPQKKPRLIDAKPVKQGSISDELDDDSSGEDIVRENWTMGKINENIICPICNKLFRSENVVFKHVKHCTGVSPNRSDSEHRSPRRSRLSQESEDADIDYETSNSDSKKDTPKKRKSNESIKAEVKPDKPKLNLNVSDVIVIEDTPMKENPDKINQEKKEESKRESKAEVLHRNKSLVCEFCGKTFRQQSYLASHKLQHRKDFKKEKKIDKNVQDSNKSEVFSCEVCKKEFRKLHHLVQHRVNHNNDSVPKRTLRKSSHEQNCIKNIKEDAVVKPIEDTSAGFRCEPCDKSFRKLHHLVEHRGTHDGINRQKPSVPAQAPVEKPAPPPQCEICKKTFRKLHHLIEHKEQHADDNSDKSDDKSIKSALSTKDIIHECSLCYMVFPNEHSLNKHTGLCSKKKRQSKQLKDTTENHSVKDEESSNLDEKKDNNDGIIPNIIASEVIHEDENILKEDDSREVHISPEIAVNKAEAENPAVTEIKSPEEKEITLNNKEADKTLQKQDVISIEVQNTPAKRDLPLSCLNKEREEPAIPVNNKNNEPKGIHTQDIPKTKTATRDKSTTLNVSKRPIDVLLPVTETIKHVESSDEDEVRYMFNPNFKVEATSEGKAFMKVSERKRNSLQIERPNSNSHAKRRTSLQHPPKIPRLKPKTVETKPKVVETKSKAVETKSKAVDTKSKAVDTKSKAIETKPKYVEPKPKVPEPNAKSVEAKSKVIDNKSLMSQPAKLKKLPILSEAEALLSTDSDDSDVKYSFPKTASEVSVPASERTLKEIAKKMPRKSLAEKRKSLGGIAKRKSLGKSFTAKHKDNSSPAKPIKKRWAVVEHRCDCGQLFSSAALLSRHTSLAHTPPRIRRRRSPPPDLPPSRPAADKPKSTAKSSVKPNATTPAPTRNSSVKKPEIPPAQSRKSVKPNEPETNTVRKTRRSAHSGVPVPEKMRKMMKKTTK